MRLLRQGIGRTCGYPNSPSHSSQPSQTRPRQQLPFSGCITKCCPNSIPHSQIAKLDPSKMRSLSWFAGDSSQLQFAEDSTTRSLFVSFAVSFAEVHGDCSCNSWKCIAIACADRWFYCDRIVRFAEVVAVAVCDHAEWLQLLYAIAAGSSWLLVQAHGIVKITSATAEYLAVTS